jgi:hypothetical protein
MNISFFTEGRYNGKIPSNYDNMNVLMSWQHLLDSYHHALYYPRWEIPANSIDIGIVIIPKKDISIIEEKLPDILNACKKVAIMQEGPADLWTGLSVEDQVTYLNILNKVDFLLCHNERDVLYFEGIFDKSVFTMPSVMVDNTLNALKPFSKKNATIISGGMNTWYNGAVSYIVATNYTNSIYSTRQRIAPGQELIADLKIIPYMDWKNWMQELSQFEIGVHLMPTYAANTFSLNCAYWGIPCIGYDYTDTQAILFPELTVKFNDIKSAVKLACRLKEDKAFYKRCSDYAKTELNKFRQDSYLEHMIFIFNSILN